MQSHMLSIVPLIVGITLTIIGSAYNNLWIIIPGLTIMLWGLVIHSNNVKVFRKSNQHHRRWGN